MSVISDIVALKKGKTYVYYDSSLHDNKQLICQCDTPEVQEEFKSLRDDVWKLYENGVCLLFQKRFNDGTFLYKAMRI